MIISASRRTDIPAFFTEWFMQRIRDGYCTAVNPFNRNQRTFVSLDSKNVDVIVFWTKNPRPLFKYLPELNARGYRFYFQYTLTGYPKQLEQNVPVLDESINTFIQFARRIGQSKMIWRYDPIIISNISDYNYHKCQFTYIAERLTGFSQRVVISFVDKYRKSVAQFKRLHKQGIFIREPDGKEFVDLMQDIVTIAERNGLEITSCAEKIDLKQFGIYPGKCIDGQYIKTIFGIDVAQQKDPYQRQECGCVPSKDIGAYGSCLHGCTYCYAGSLQEAIKNWKNHFVDSSVLLGK